MKDMAPLSAAALQPPKKRHFAMVDVLRGFAAVTVLVYHCIEQFKWESFPNAYGLFWFRIGWLGVDIFFVISGFVITLSALNLAEKENYKNFQLKFMSRRLRRMVPLHYLTLAIFIFLTPEVIKPSFFYDLFSHLFFFHNTIQNFHGSINGPNWSVATEMQFYILISLGIYFFKTRNLLYICLTFLLVCYMWRMLSFLLVTHDNLYPFPLFVKATQLPGMLDLFLGGILLAFFVRSRLFYKIFSGRFSLLISIMFTFICCYFTLSIYMANGVFWNNIWMVVFFRTLNAISVTLILLVLCQIKLNNIFKKLLAPLIYLGTISYGIYLFHFPILLQIKKINLSPEGSFFLTLGITLVCAALSWEFFESKFLRNRHY